MGFVWKKPLTSIKELHIFSILRNTFDRYVLFDETYSLEDEIALYIENITQKKDYQIQIQHSGKDDPPGVKNWYDFSENLNLDNNELILECQKQNGIWTKKLLKYKILITVIVCLVVVFILKCIVAMKKLNGIYILFGTIALILKFIERIYLHYKYLRMIPKIEGAIESASIHGNTEQIEYVQKCFENLRDIPVFGINVVHKVLAKKYSNMYQNIQQRRSPHN